MKDFDWTTFNRRIAVKSTMQEMYNAWTTSAELEKWFLKKAIFHDGDKRLVSPIKNIQKGFSYTWSWYLYDPVENGMITEANGKDFFQFTFAGQCLIDIKLIPLDNFVMVELTQKNIPTDDNSKKSIRLGCDSGWSFFLVNLKSVYEGGHDLRNKYPNLKGMVNN